MSAKRHERTAARRAALQVLYSGELVDSSAATIRDQGAYIEDEDRMSPYAIALAKGAAFNVGEIDAYLKEASENWALDRMPVVDRCILRLAVYEMLYEDKVPVSVSVNEAVELAKEFGGEDDSYRFVNGVLGRIARRIDPEADIEEEPEAPAEVEDVE